MFCSKCGNEINDQAVVCPNCGCSTGNDNQSMPLTDAPMIKNEEKKTLASCALVFAILMPIVGLILGIVGVIKYQTSELKKKCIAAIPISIVVWIITAVIMFSA
ncbi:MAG: hypothetical protein NC397_00195 [Clostridium sp.]|nr:hypothetical protein [Clostridium sp.]